MKKFLFIILSFILCIPTVYALDECTPSDDYLEFLSLSEKERKDAIEPIKCKEMLNINANKAINNINRDIDSFLGVSTGLTRYNSVEDNIVSPVQDQVDDGTCWAFSAMSVLETNAAKNGLPLYNLSEAHMAYSLVDGLYLDIQGQAGKYHANANGGKITYPASYFFNNGGMLFESELSYPLRSKYHEVHLPQITSSEYIQGRHILSVDKFEMVNLNDSGVCTNNEIYNIKRLIATNGSVQATMYMDESLLKENKYYYSYDTPYINHAITIIGWDDSISKDHFGASRDGAWIIKNSWGTTWGNNGYFYISYDDDRICQDVVSYSGVNDIEYDNTYQSSELVGTMFKQYNPLTFIASKFDKKSSDNEVIKKISFSSAYADYDTQYSIYITYDDNLKDDSKWELLATASSNNLGIESVYVNTPIKNDKYTIIIKYLSQTSFYSLATAKNTDDQDTKFLTYEPNKNYVALYGLNRWDDTSTAFSNPFEPNIFVYTDVESVASSSITIDEVTEDDDGVHLNLTNDYSIEISSIKLYDLNDNDVTTDFDVAQNNNEIIIKNTNNKSGQYNVVITDSENKELHTFYDFKETMTLSNNYSLDQELKLITIPANTSYDTITRSIIVKNSNMNIYNGSSRVTSGFIGSGFLLQTNNNTYYFIVKGDLNQDSAMNSGDLFAMRKHLLGTSLNTLLVIAGDLNNDGIINSGDLFLLRKELLKG